MCMRYGASGPPIFSGAYRQNACGFTRRAALLGCDRRTYTHSREMSITLQVPDSVARSLRLPENEVEARLRCELALSLYSQGILSLGKAAELAAISRYRFGELATSRGIPRHYGAEELAEDLAYGRGE